MGRVLKVIDCLAAAPEGASLTGLAAATATPKSTLLGFLRALAAEGYAAQQEGSWHLGPEALGLARAILARQQDTGLNVAARPVLQALANASGESAMLAVLAADRGAMIYADKVESRTALRFAASVGDRRPIHCTASGRVMLAFHRPGWPEEFLSTARLVPATTTSVTDRRALRRIVTEARAKGYAVTSGEATEGVVGIAAPVFDARGEAIAAIVLAAPMARAQPKLAALARRVCQAGRELSRRLGHRPQPDTTTREE